VTTKRISGGAEWIGCDTGFNHLARPSKYGSYHHILNATNGDDASLRETYDAKRRREEVVVAGNICESGDVFTRDAAGKTRLRAIDETKAGDLLAFCDAGAYGFSMASHYNARLLPAEVMVDGRGARLIRERQTYDDLLRGQP
jgi:diaminopimelate decarboxylase